MCTSQKYWTFARKGLVLDHVKKENNFLFVYFKKIVILEMVANLQNFRQILGKVVKFSFFWKTSESSWWNLSTCVQENFSSLVKYVKIGNSSSAAIL